MTGSHVLDLMNVTGESTVLDITSAADGLYLVSIEIVAGNPEHSIRFIKKVLKKTNFK
jgi:hypothetical protein